MAWRHRHLLRIWILHRILVREQLVTVTGEVGGRRIRGAGTFYLRSAVLFLERGFA
jgi:hypothetical protein